MLKQQIKNLYLICAEVNTWDTYVRYYVFSGHKNGKWFVEQLDKHSRYSLNKFFTFLLEGIKSRSTFLNYLFDTTFCFNSGPSFTVAASTNQRPVSVKLGGQSVSLAKKTTIASTAFASTKDSSFLEKKRSW